MDGPRQQATSAEPAAPESLPGHFVSEEHRSDCARFLDEVKTMVDRRRKAGWEPRRPGADWFAG